MFKTEFFCIFFKKFKILYFVIIFVEVGLVELKLKVVAFCDTKIGPFLSKNGKNDVIFGLKWL